MNALVVWRGALRRLSAELPEYVLDSWLRPMGAEETDAGLRLVCPSGFHRDRVRDRYLVPISRCVAEEAGRAVPVALGVGETAMPRAPVEVDAAAYAQQAAAGRARDADGAGAAAFAPPTLRADPRAVRHAPRRAPGSPAQPSLPYAFETFVVGPCNALAQAASIEVASGRRSLSPLYLAAGSGLGKTHLARAVAREAERRAARVVYAPAELFTGEFGTAIRTRRAQGFKRRYRDCDLLVIEDVEFLRAKRSTQLELFHIIDHLIEAGRRVVLTADRLPREIPDLDARLGSRMASGLVAEIEPPDAEVRRRILKARAAAGGVHLPEDCLDRLVEAVRGSVRDLEAVLIQLVASASLLKQPIDPALTEAALRKIAPQAPPAAGRLSLRAVVGVVAAFFQTAPGALASRSRRRDVLVPRQLAMYLCHRYSGASLPEIGHAFGRKSPSVSNAIANVERRILEHAPLRYQVEALCDRLDALARGDR